MLRIMLRLGKEMSIAAVLLAIGLFALPALVYWVGERVVGDYDAAGGMTALMSQVRTDLIAGNPLAWLLVGSPYLVVQLLRLARRIWKASPTVKSVTFSDVNQ